MSITEMHRRFVLRMDKADSLANPSFEPEEIDEFLNIAQERVVKQRYSGNNPHGAKYEEVQKRTEDLKKIKKRITLFAVSSPFANPYAAWFPLPEDHMITTQEQVFANVTDCNGKQSRQRIAKVKAITDERYSTMVSNSFWKPTKDQVLRLVVEDNIEIIGSEEVTPLELVITYLKHPRKMSKDLGIDCELSEHLHDEIVTEAVGLAMGSIQDTRIELNLREQNTQE